ncbi:GxxExxY protein [Nibrella viscosa]|uniref:GxxExxY protein n=1 Tax=Nibrella viscosa TaxID=1084524 RepID=UPI00351A3F44
MWSLNKQLLTYLCLSDMRLGMLANFNALIKDSIRHIVNNLKISYRPGGKSLCVAA